MNAGKGYSFRLFQTTDKKWWVCVMHEHGKDYGPHKRKGVAMGKGRRRDTARQNCISEFWARGDKSKMGV